MMKIFIIFGVIALLTSCDFADVPPHEQYQQNLVTEGLRQDAALWESSAEFALANPLRVRLPYQERRILHSPSVFRASAFSVELAVGQRLQVHITLSENSQAPIFVDVFEVSHKPRPVLRASKDPLETLLEFEASRSSHYIVRVQPGFRAAGQMDLALSSPPKFPFPVANSNAKSIQSFFGDPRDGGRRSHKGVDIFDERGTAILSSSDGRVTRVGDSTVGGKHVWVRDGRYSFYYAHLDSIDVKRGESVNAGDRLGTLGNTGNALTTPPHLHFGVYQRFHGAINPLPLIDDTKVAPKDVLEKFLLAPRWLSVSATQLNLRAAPSIKSVVLERLKKGELLQVFASVGEWLRVETASGDHGYVSRALTQIPSSASWVANRSYVLQNEPYAYSPVLKTINPGEELETLGHFGRFQLVRLPEGVTGWALALKEPDDIGQL